MLKKSNKITKTKEFDNVFQNGKSSFNSLIGVKVIKNNLKEPRFGIIVSTKVSKKAVIRNKIKRQIRSIIFEELNKIKQNLDCIIITLPRIEKANYLEIQKSLQKNFKKVSFYK